MTRRLAPAPAPAPPTWAPLEFDLAVNPIPLARGRVALDRRGGAHAYLPASTQLFNTELQWALRLAGVRSPVVGDLRLSLRLWRRCRTARGDLSNMVKAFEDACNEVLWEDDRQVVALDAELVDWGPRVKGRIVARIEAVRRARPSDACAAVPQ